MSDLPLAFVPLEETDELLNDDSVIDPVALAEYVSAEDGPETVYVDALGPLSEEERLVIEQMRLEAEALADVIETIETVEPPAPPKPTVRERVESIRAFVRRVRGNSVDITINTLTLIGVLAALACLVFLVMAGTSAYGRNPLLAGLDVWFALLSAGVTYTAIRVAFTLQRKVALRNSPAIHANDLMHRR